MGWPHAETAQTCPLSINSQEQRANSRRPNPKLAREIRIEYDDPPNAANQVTFNILVPLLSDCHFKLCARKGYTKDSERIMMKKKKFIVLLLRGVLGGAVGAFLLLAILLYMTGLTWDNWLGWLLISYLAFGLPCGAFIGALVASVILLINRQAGMSLGTLSRVLIGTLIAIVFWILFFWQKETSEYGYGRSWLRSVFAVLLFSITTGGFAALTVGRQKDSASKVSGTSKPNPRPESDEPRVQEQQGMT